MGVIRVSKSNEFSIIVYRIDETQENTYHHLKTVELKGIHLTVDLRLTKLSLKTDLESFTMYLQKPDQLRIQVWK